MLFNSLEFLILFMPLVLGIALKLRGDWLLGWIALASFVFYAYAGHAWFLLPMAVTTVLDFWVGARLAATPKARRRPYLMLSLLGNLGLLAYFKYSGLLVRSTAALFGNDVHLSFLQVVLPAGISFYTFQTMSYVIDIYRDEAHAEKSFVAYISFVAFFPHLVAGPLTRHNQLIPQLRDAARAGITPRWSAGIALFSIGLCKKVLLADRLGSWIDPLLEHISGAGLATGWLSLLGYALQIYFDFSGYSDMAIGLGRLFAIELPQNFDSPYQASDPSDFWRRWHITLSQWLRDYLYISLGGNRQGALRTQLNLLITMTLGGLWHGANWTFAIWGLYHGLLLVAYHASRAFWERRSLGLRRALTFSLICVGWVFFRAPSIAAAASWFAALAGNNGVGAIDETSYRLIAWVGVGLLVCNLAPNAYRGRLEGLTSLRAGFLAAATAVAIVLMNYSSKFLYFQF